MYMIATTKTGQTATKLVKVNLCPPTMLQSARVLDLEGEK
jgi:hypothetical protein